MTLMCTMGDAQEGGGTGYNTASVDVRKACLTTEEAMVSKVMALWLRVSCYTF